MRPPRFWQQPGHPAGQILSPLGWIYHLATQRRLSSTRPGDCGAAVICVGNLSAGGQGKTPVVLSLLADLKARGRSPAALSRGHGGLLEGPVSIDPEQHSARDVGDEPLQLVQQAPAWIARNRLAGARAAVAANADIIVMDDGFQNPSLKKDVSLIVVDGAQGFGNEEVIPAGPLRERIRSGLKRADGLVIIGKDTYLLTQRFQRQLPIFTARLQPDNSQDLIGQKLLAFAGIGRPEKFFTTLREIGADLCATHSFTDHHPFAERELEELQRRAEDANAQLITTRKDWMRLPKDWQDRVQVLDVQLIWDGPSPLDHFARQLSL